MGLDIRLPIGLMFTLIGVLMSAYGLFTPAEMYQRSLNINVNLWWGLFLVVFGVWMLFSALRSSKKAEE